MSLVDRDARLVWHPFTQTRLEGPPVPIARAEGASLFRPDGTEIIDAIASWWVNLHGHSHPRISAAIAEQLPVLAQVIFAGFTHESAVLAAERLQRVLPGAPRRIFFSDDGSTAVEAALKMALQYWHNRGTPRRTILALRNGYHGDTFGAMAVSSRGAYNGPFEELLFEVRFIDAPSAGRETAALDQLRALLRDEPAAAFIYEPLIQGAGGMRMYEPAALDALLALCRENEVICIADEVLTGFGRSGTLFASSQMKSPPDIICLSKALTGGFLPLGVTAAAEWIYEAFVSDQRAKLLWHGHSFTGNALSCAAAAASIELAAAPEFPRSVARIEAAHGRFAEVLRGTPGVEEVRHKGMILAFDVHSPAPSSYTNPLRDELYRRFLDRGVLLRPLGNVVYVLPPVCVTNAQLERVYATIVDVLGECVGQGICG